MLSGVAHMHAHSLASILLVPQSREGCILNYVYGQAQPSPPFEHGTPVLFDQADPWAYLYHPTGAQGEFPHESDALPLVAFR